MSKVRFIVLVLFALLLPLAPAQTPDTATLSGTVVDATHALVTGAEISVTNLQTGLQRGAMSDSQGKFSIGGLPVAGVYEVAASKSGFAKTHLGAVKLAGGSTAKISLQLTVASGETEVSVIGTAGDVRVDQPQLGIHLEAAQIEETPLPNNRITYLPLLSAANRPAINQGDIFMNQNLFTTNGAGRRQSWFEVDGVSGNDSWGRQTIFTNIPKSAVQEMTVLTNSFSAEYGASTGSVVNIVTKSGGDQFHGNAAFLWRPTAPEASLAGFTPTNATTGNEVTSDRLLQESFALGGPVKFSPKTRFFVAAEHSDQGKSSPISSPLNISSYVGVYHDWLGFLRLDHQFNRNNNGFVRGNVDAFYDTNPNGIVGGASLPSVARVFRRRTYSLEFGDTAVLNAKLLNNARASSSLLRRLLSSIRSSTAHSPSSLSLDWPRLLLVRRSPRC